MSSRNWFHRLLVMAAALCFVTLGLANPAAACEDPCNGPPSGYIDPKDLCIPYCDRILGAPNAVVEILRDRCIPYC